MIRWSDAGWQLIDAWWPLGNMPLFNSREAFCSPHGPMMFHSMGKNLDDSSETAGFVLRCVTQSDCLFKIPAKSHDGSMVLLYMVTWIPSRYPLYVSIYIYTIHGSYGNDNRRLLGQPPRKTTAYHWSHWRAPGNFHEWKLDVVETPAKIYTLW